MDRVAILSALRHDWLWTPGSVAASGLKMAPVWGGLNQ